MLRRGVHLVGEMNTFAEEEPATKRKRLTENSKESMRALVKHLEKNPPDADSPLHILNILSDNCLQEIFKLISIVDLSSVSEVCSRLRRNAAQIFSVYHEKRFRFVSLTLIKPKVIYNFAHLIKSVYLNGSEANQCLDYFIESDTETMQSLHLRGTHVDINKLKRFPNLTSLELSNSYFRGRSSEVSTFFSHCSNLRHLKAKLSRFDLFSPCKMPALEKFEYHDYVFSKNLQPFICKNAQLSVVSITTVNKSLAPIGFEEILLQFGNMHSLKVLKLPCFQVSVGPLLNSLQTNNISIEQIELENCDVPAESFATIMLIKTIKVLTLTGIKTLTNEPFVNLAKNLPQLEVLRLETMHKHNPNITVADIINCVLHTKNLYLLTIGIISNLTIDQAAYNQLLHVILCAGKRKSLTITVIYEHRMEILVPKQILKKNKKHIRIIKIKYVNSADYDSDNYDAYLNDGSDESSGILSFLGSDDESDDNSDDSWLKDVYNK